MRAGRTVDRYSYFRGKSDRYIAHDAGSTFVASFAYGVTDEAHAMRLTALANDMLALRRRSLWQRIRWALRPVVSEP